MRRWVAAQRIVPVAVPLVLLAAAGFLVAYVAGPGAQREEAAWRTVQAEFASGIVHTMQYATWLSSAPALAALYLGTFAFLLHRHAWRSFYALVATGLASGATVILGQWVGGRPPPLEAMAPLPYGSFPAESPLVLLPGLLITVWLHRSGRAPVAVAVAFLTGVVAVAPAVTGHAWPTDIVGGSLVVAMGAVLASRWITAPPATDAAAPWSLRPWEDRLLWVAIALGVLLRVSTFWTYSLGIDANRYAVMGHAMLRGEGLTMPWGPVYGPDGQPAPSQHYPPLYPLYLAGFFAVFGPSADTVHAAAIASSLAAVAVVYACSRDLYGARAGRIAAAVVALNPVLLQSTGKGYGENLVLLLFAVTLWGIIKSLSDRRWIMAAGVAAGLGYLVKGSMGAFFVLAGLGGLAWRLRWNGWRVFQDRYYMAAAATFAAIVGAWALRNLHAHGSWHTSTHLQDAYAAAAGVPLSWALYFVVSILFLTLVGCLVFLGMLPWLPWMRRIPVVRTEHDSGLWLAVLLPLVLASVIEGALWLHEGRFFFNNIRYVTFVVVPATWLLLRHVRPCRQARLAAVVMATILLCASAVMALPSHPLAARMSDTLRGHVQDGDEVTFVGTRDVYRYYFDITMDGTREVSVRLSGPDEMTKTGSQWIVVRGEAPAPAGYVLHAQDSYRIGSVADRYTVWRLQDGGDES